MIYTVHMILLLIDFFTYWGHEILVSKISTDIVIYVCKCLIPSVFVSYA